MSSELAAIGPSDSTEKLVHLALPVRLTHLSNGERNASEAACTYDIHPRGARLMSSREVNIGDLLQLERGRSKAVYRVIWTADSRSPLRGQFTVQSVDEARAPWEDELRQVQEQFLPILSAEELKSLSGVRRGNENKRRRPRFPIEGAADLIQLDGPTLRLTCQVKQLSELGCLIRATETILPGANLKVALNVYDVSVSLRGQVKYSLDKTGVGVEFTEIRQGDRPLLSYVLSALAGEKRGPDPKPVAAAAGL
jgi:ribosomal 50S subunit-recycling heat shock protein